MKKRLLSIALCLCMVLTLLPTAALATSTAATGVWVNGVELNSTTPYLASNNATEAQALEPSGGYAYFNNGTLTLSNYQNSTSMTDQSTLGVHKIGTTVTTSETSDIWAAIYADGDLNLVLSGTNMVNTKDGNDSNLAREAACVYVTGALNISGTGSTALNTGNSCHPGTGEGDTRTANPCNYGIYAGSLTVNSGTLKLDPGTTRYDPMLEYNITTVKTVKNTAGGKAFAYGIYSAGSIDINGGSVTAESVACGSLDTNAQAYGIYAAGTLSVAAGGAVTAGNYTKTMSPLAASWGIYSGDDMTLSGTVTANAAVGMSGTTTGIESDAGLTVNGSAVVSATANGSSLDSAQNAYGVKGDSVTISDSANVTSGAYASQYSNGIYGGTVTLEDAAVITAKADGLDTCVAVNAENTLDVPADATYTNKSADSTEKQILAEDKTKDVVIHCDSRVRIIFDACNGSATENIVVADLTALQPAPTITGYTFAGWYPASNFETAEGKAFTDGDKLTLEKATALETSDTYYAKWTVGEDGKIVRTTPLALGSYTEDIDKSSTQGWAWDFDDKILTLSGANIVTTGQYALDLRNLDPVEIVLTEGSVNALSATGGNVTNSARLYSDTLVTLSGTGTLNAIGGKGSGNSAGIIAPLTVDGATVTATGSSYGILGNLTLISGAVTASGDKYGLSCGGATINGGTLNATGATAGINSNGAITVALGASVTATATGDVGESYGLQINIAQPLEVNGTLTAKGGTGAYSRGVKIHGDLIGSGIITATGGTATGDSAGLYLVGSSSFSGTLTAIGGAGSESYGILGTNPNVAVALTTDITASCDATASRHFPVLVAGTFDYLTTQTFPGSIASSAGMTVYDDDTVLAQNGYFDLVNNTSFSALTIKADKTLTIVPTAKLYVASAEAITIETDDEVTGQLVNNGWIVLDADAEDTGATIAALGITGEGYILAGDTVYSNDGAKNEKVITDGIDLSDGEDETATGKYTYENNMLTIADGTVVLGNVMLPAGAETTVDLKNGAFVLGNLSIEGEGEGKLNITVAQGDSATIGGIDVQQVVQNDELKDFLLTIGGGGTLASSRISLSFADDYGANKPYDMSVVVEKGTTLNITNSLDELGAGITINTSANTGGLTVRGTIAVHTPNAPSSLRLPRITIERGASLSAGCKVAAELMASSGRALTMEIGSTFNASGTKASIVIVVHPDQSIEDLVSLPSGTLPSGVSFRQFYSNYAPNDTLYTLARQDDVLVDEGNENAYIPTGGEASVELLAPYAGSSASYTLTFDTNGGSSISAVSKVSGTTVDLTTYNPTKTDYDFDGWYSDAAFTEKVTSVNLTKSMTVYAKWAELSPSDLPFTDVAASAYYYDAVQWAVENGVAAGTTATTFAPNATCTRAQTVTFLWRANGSPEPTSTVNPFTDVSPDAYYYKAVLWTVEKGITAGITATTFAPNATCTRAQIVTFLYRNFSK